MWTLVILLGGCTINQDPQVQIDPALLEECQHDAEKCTALASQYRGAGDSKIRDDVIAGQLLTYSCEKNDPEACVLLGIMYSAGIGVQKSESKEKKLTKKGNALYHQTCDAGHLRNCVELGGMYLYGVGLPKSKQKATDLWVKACAGQEASGCTSLGDMFKKTDKQRSLNYYGKACDLGDEDSCSHFSDLLEGN